MNIYRYIVSVINVTLYETYSNLRSVGSTLLLCYFVNIAHQGCYLKLKFYRLCRDMKKQNKIQILFLVNISNRVAFSFWYFKFNGIEEDFNIAKHINININK